MFYFSEKFLYLLFDGKTTPSSFSMSLRIFQIKLLHYKSYELIPWVWPRLLSEEKLNVWNFPHNFHATFIRLTYSFVQRHGLCENICSTRFNFDITICASIIRKCWTANKKLSSSMWITHKSSVFIQNSKEVSRRSVAMMHNEMH